MKITPPILPFAKIIAVIWLLSVGSSLSQTRISDQELPSKANQYMDNLAKLDYFSGAVLIARDGRVLLSRGYGMADLDHDVPNAPTTKFRIGSVTKQFTAMAVMLLQEQGRLSVHDPVCKYVPACPAEWQRITIHHLLSHTSGIPSFTDFPDNDDYERRHMTLLATMDRFKNKPLEFKPGEKFNYSDSNYLVLAYVIEKASGQSYESFLKEKIYQPLGMSNSGYDHPQMILKQRAIGYLRQGDVVINNSHYFVMDTPCGGGSQYSTVEDLYRWDQSLNTEKIVSRRSLDAMFTPHTPESYQWHGYFKYGYGWMLGELFHRKIIWHDGGINGFVSYIGRYPDEKLTIILLSNREDAFVRRASMDLAAIAFQEPYSFPKAAVKIGEDVLTSYVGHYRFEDGRVFEVVKEEGAIHWADSEAPLIAQSETQFLSNGGAAVVFVKGKDGAVNHLVVAGDVTAKKVEPPPSH
jgi:CubicO group peptidase (beta-lactamase class C family)